MIVVSSSKRIKETFVLESLTNISIVNLYFQYMRTTNVKTKKKWNKRSCLMCNKERKLASYICNKNDKLPWNYHWRGLMQWK